MSGPATVQIRRAKPHETTHSGPFRWSAQRFPRVVMAMHHFPHLCAEQGGNVTAQHHQIYYYGVHGLLAYIGKVRVCLHTSRRCVGAQPIGARAMQAQRLECRQMNSYRREKGKSKVRTETKNPFQRLTSYPKAAISSLHAIQGSVLAQERSQFVHVGTLPSADQTQRQGFQGFLPQLQPGIDSRLLRFDAEIVERLEHRQPVPAFRQQHLPSSSCA